QQPKERGFNTIIIVLDLPRDELYQRINKRVDLMVEAGLESEAKNLYSFRHLTPLKTVGYREWFDYFDGKISKTEAIEQIKNHTRTYARKQLTWFRKYKDAHWFNPNQTDEIVKLVKSK
ncbi:MAG: tRNA (adenosine(37)-N6)-dimethylallyltransferase MiaA, partial [Bacteroidales bacterium]|nr:tRNA (adenosine(37)-N6)-dimethylallyltransferase MiaA [Bacteroidales bacterium]